MTVKDMLGRSGVVSREEALRLLCERFVVPAIPSEDLPLPAALGRVLSQDLSAPEDLPGFDRSTMDGYAVRSADTFGAAESRPALLTVAGDVPMGAVPGRTLQKGEALKIATGGALPAGADAVVMLEQIQAVDAASIEVVKAVGPLENVVRRGEDIGKGDTFLARGHRLRPQDLAALASLGIVQVPAYRRPTVGLISTGNEIVPAETVPGPGRIRDSNSYNLEGLVALAGGAPFRRGIVPDDLAMLRSAVRTAIGEHDLVLLTGGSSVGTADLSARVIDEAGGSGVLVHGVAIKPGKPLLFGIADETGRSVPIFGLPGHPAAVSICFDLFVKPVLLRLTGETPPPALAGIPAQRMVRARLARSIASSPGREEFVRVSLEKKDDGLWARPVFGASGLITTLVRAHGTVAVPINTIGIEAGEEVEVRLF